jgi:hypothetical protein
MLMERKYLTRPVEVGMVLEWECGDGSWLGPYVVTCTHKNQSFDCAMLRRSLNGQRAKPKHQYGTSAREVPRELTDEESAICMALLMGVDP